MPSLRSASDLSTATISLMPLGVAGLDTFTHEALLGPDHLRQADNVRKSRLSIDRRKGAKKLWQFADLGGSKTFGADTRYATITAASQLQTLAAGFALVFHITAVRAGAGDTAFILSSRVASQTYHVLQVSLDENGLLSVTFEKASGGAATVTTSAIAAGATAHCLALFDPVGGTFTVYVDGASSGTPVTGLTIADGPIAGASTAWHIGAHYDPTGGAVVADTHFDGKIQGLTLMSLRGQRPASGTTTLVDTLIRHSARVWPAPEAPNVVFQYDLQGSSITTLTDASRFQNDATVTGTITDTASIVAGSIPSNYAGYVDGASGRGDNVIGSAGRLFYETIRTGE